MRYFVKSLRVTISCSALLLTCAKEPAAQVISEARVDSALRALLQVRSSDTLLIVRDYASPFFPRTTFYRAQYTFTNMTDVPAIREGAAVVARDSMVTVRSLMDLPAVWSLTAGASNSPASFSFSCTSLLFATGLLGRGARIIEAASEIKPYSRKQMIPQSGLKHIAPQTYDRENGRLIARFTAWDGGDVIVFECSLNNGTFAITADTVAHEPPNNP